MWACRAALGAAGKVAIARTRRPVKSAIEITEAAAVRLQDLLSKKPEAVGIRVGVKTRGCNGQSYTMNYATEKAPKDEEVVEKGVRVLIEPGALMKIVGTTMDWKEDELSAQFVFNNPNAKSVCGCGESFNT